MRTVYPLLKNDIAYLKKDPMTLICLLIPILMVVFYRLIIVRLEFLDEFLPYIRYLFISMVAITSGMGVGFRVLDDKDEHMLTFYAVSPIGILNYYRYRLGISLGISLIGGAILISGLELDILWIQKLVVFGVILLLTPIGMGILMLICKNKIQGLTFMKFSSLILIVPLFHALGESRLSILLHLMPTDLLYHIIVGEQVKVDIYVITFIELIGANYIIYKKYIFE